MVGPLQYDSCVFYDPIYSAVEGPGVSLHTVLIWLRRSLVLHLVAGQRLAMHP